MISSVLLKLEHTSLQILFIIFLVAIGRIIVEIIIKKLFTDKRKENIGKNARISRRVHTIFKVINSLTIAIVFTLCILLVLGNFFNLTGVLASAGILGIGVSLGAQSLFKDFITGFFFLSQDQFGVGDIVQVGPPYNLIGKITSISLRTITIRDFSGNATVISNSTITLISNLTKDWSMADMTFTFPSSTPVDNIFSLLTKAADDLFANAGMKHYLIDTYKILGVESLADGKIGIRVNIKTVPGKQFDIAREYRLNVKRIMEEREISIS